MTSTAQPTLGPRVWRVSDLTPARRRLLELITAAHFGRIEDLHVRGGEPHFDPRPRALKTVKIAGHKRPVAPAPAADAALRREWHDLFAQLETLRDGVVRRIEFADGLPLFIEIVDEPART